MKHFRLNKPVAGWFAVVLTCILALIPAFAASQSQLRPAGFPLACAGIIGLLIGMDRARTLFRQPPRSHWIHGLNVFIHLVVWLFGGTILLLMVGNALPPLALSLRDLEIVYLRAQNLSTEEPRAGLFLAQAATRLATELRAAPTTGEAGARLMIGTVGAVFTWIATIFLGHSLYRPRTMLRSILVMLVAVLVVAIPGGAGGLAIAFGMGLGLLLVASALANAYVFGWEQRQIDYSSEHVGDIRLWASIVIMLALLGAWIIPLWPGNPVSAWIASIGETPSGIAALEEGIGNTGTGDRPDRVGLSILPSLRLGRSIEQGPPEQIALQIQLNTPLPAGSPIYWRMRILETYRSNDWTSAARVVPQAATPLSATFPGAVVQRITDRRPDKQLIVALPDVLALSLPTKIERLPDESLTAITGNPPESSYTVLSRLPAFAPVPERDQSPPDFSPYLAVPDTLPPRVRELAAVIVANQRGQRAQALALETYLRTLQYSYQVQPLPADGDAVDQFLFEMRSGYCTYYASALAIMARTQGIPARVAIGYAAGELLADGSYLVRESDAHAWTELYLDERWEVFEPTPIRALPARGTLTTSIEAQTTESTVAQAWLVPEWVWVTALLIPLVLIVGVWAYRRRQFPPMAPDPLSIAAAELERTGARLGVVWPQGTTLREYRDHLLTRANTAAPIQRIVALIERGRYTGKQLTWDELLRLEDERERLRDEQGRNQLGE